MPRPSPRLAVWRVPAVSDTKEHFPMTSHLLAAQMAAKAECAKFGIKVPDGGFKSMDDVDLAFMEAFKNDASPRVLDRRVNLKNRLDAAGLSPEPARVDPIMQRYALKHILASKVDFPQNGEKYTLSELNAKL